MEREKEGKRETVRASIGEERGSESEHIECMGSRMICVLLQWRCAHPCASDRAQVAWSGTRGSASEGCEASGVIKRAGGDRGREEGEER